MNTTGFTSVERAFIEKSGRKGFSTRLPYIVVHNFPDLVLLCRGLHFVQIDEYLKCAMELEKSIESVAV